MRIKKQKLETPETHQQLAMLFQLAKQQQCSDRRTLCKIIGLLGPRIAASRADYAAWFWECLPEAVMTWDQSKAGALTHLINLTRYTSVAYTKQHLYTGGVHVTVGNMRRIIKTAHLFPKPKPDMLVCDELGLDPSDLDIPGNIGHH